MIINDDETIWYIMISTYYLFGARCAWARRQWQRAMLFQCGAPSEEIVLHVALSLTSLKRRMSFSECCVYVRECGWQHGECTALAGTGGDEIELKIDETQAEIAKANSSSNENELPIKIRVLTFCLCCLNDLPKMALRLGLHRLVLSNSRMLLYAALRISSSASSVYYSTCNQPASHRRMEHCVCFGAPLMLSHSMPCDTKYHIIYGSFKKFIHVFFVVRWTLSSWLATRQFALYVCSSFYLPSFALVCLQRDDQRLHLHHIFGDAGSTRKSWKPLSRIHKKPCSSLSTSQNTVRDFSPESLGMVLMSVRCVSDTTLISVYACKFFILTCEYCVGRRAYRE